ncbi:hypothetical protein ACWDA9_41810, partial [Streptomyces sp. NPDC001193]
MHKRRLSLALATTAALMCTTAVMPSAAFAVGRDLGGSGESYAERHDLTVEDVRDINALNERALDLAAPGGRPPGGLPPGAVESLRPSASADDRVTPPAEPLDSLPAAYRAYGGAAERPRRAGHRQQTDP